MKNSVQPILIDTIVESLPEIPQIINYDQGLYITSVCATLPGDIYSLVFVSKDRVDKIEMIKKTISKIIICDLDVNINQFELQDKCLLKVSDPKLCFSIVVNKYFVEKPKPGIHPSSVIHPSAKIHSSVYIGPNCSIGIAEIGEDSILYGNIFIYDNVKMGKYVTINSGTVIGAEGFGYNRMKDGTSIQFPHLGGVIIEDDVEIGSNTSIDRGALANTIIKKGAKIDNLVHIAHNVIIEEDAWIIANAMIGGSTIIGKTAYIGPSTCIRDVIKIGTEALIGMGSVVTKNVPDSEIWAGNPARPLKELLEINEKLKKQI